MEKKDKTITIKDEMMYCVSCEKETPHVVNQQVYDGEKPWCTICAINEIKRTC